MAVASAGNQNLDNGEVSLVIVPVTVSLGSPSEDVEGEIRV